MNQFHLQVINYNETASYQSIISNYNVLNTCPVQLSKRVASKRV